MKGIYIIVFLLLASPAYGQVPALLSIEGIGGDGYDDIHQRVVNTADGGFILSLGTSSHSGPILCDTNHTTSIFMKYNADGTVLEWKKCFNNAYMFLFPASDGNFIVGGYRTNGGNGWDYYISKIDTDGNTIWITYYGGSSDDQLKDMMFTNDGGYIMIGASNSNDGDVGLHYGSMFDEDIWAIKLDSNGNKIWSKVIGGSNIDYAVAVVHAPSGGCYIIGRTNSYDHDCTGYHGSGDAYVARLDDSGYIVWHHCLGGSASDANAGWATEDGKGGVIIATGSYSTDGEVHNHVGNMDIWVVNVDSNNNIVWDNSYGGSSVEIAYTVAKASDGSVWIGGASQSTDGQVGLTYGNGDAWIVHADSAGNFLSGKVLGESEADGAYVLQPLPGGLIMTAGEYNGAGAIGGEFPNDYWGASDVFIARLAPWTTDVIQVAVNGEQVRVYPNPVHEQLTLTGGISGEIVRVINAMGQTVLRQKSEGKETVINMGGLQSGVYFISVCDDGRGVKVVRRFVKE